MNHKKTFIYAAIIIVLLLFVYSIRNYLQFAFAPFLMGAILFYTLSPTVYKLADKAHTKRRRFFYIRALSIIFILIIVILVSSFSIFVIPRLIGDLSQILDNIPRLAEKINTLFGKIIVILKKYNVSNNIQTTLTMSTNKLVSSIITFSNTISLRLTSYLDKTVAIIGDFFVGIIIGYYLIVDKNRIRNSVLSLFSSKHTSRINRLFIEINQTIYTFLRSQIFVAIVVGLLEAAGLYFVGFKNFFILGMIGGLANLIPFIGPIIGSIPAVLVALIDDPEKAIGAIIIFILVQQLDNAIITPNVVEKNVGIHPLISIFSILVFGCAWGIVGMFIAVPVVAIIKIIFTFILQHFYTKPQYDK